MAILCHLETSLIDLVAIAFTSFVLVVDFNNRAILNDTWLFRKRLNHNFSTINLDTFGTTLFCHTESSFANLLLGRACNCSIFLNPAA